MKVKYEIKKYIFKVGDKVYPISKSVGNFEFNESEFYKKNSLYYVISDLTYMWENEDINQRVQVIKVQTQKGNYELYSLKDLRPYEDKI